MTPEPDNTDITPQTVLEPGDYVRLKEGDYRGHEFGIVTEISNRYHHANRTMDEHVGVTDTTAPPAEGAPRNVVAVLRTGKVPPAIINAAPFSYDPYHRFYTEVHREPIGKP